MTDSSAAHLFKSHRLPDLNYTEQHFYYLTLCTDFQLQLFGEVTDGRMELNWIGMLVDEEWRKSAEIRQELVFDCHEAIS